MGTVRIASGLEEGQQELMLRMAHCMQLAVQHAVHNMHHQRSGLGALYDLQQPDHYAAVTMLVQSCSVQYVASMKAHTSCNHRLPGWPMTICVFFVSSSCTDKNDQ